MASKQKEATFCPVTVSGEGTKLMVVKTSSEGKLVLVDEKMVLS